MGFKSLRPAPEVDERCLMHAGDGAIRRACFWGQKFAANDGDGVALEGCTGITTLLGAMVLQPVLTYREVTGASATAPVIRVAQRNVVLVRVEAGIAVFAQLFHF